MRPCDHACTCAPVVCPSTGSAALLLQSRGGNFQLLRKLMDAKCETATAPEKRKVVPGLKGSRSRQVLEIRCSPRLEPETVSKTRGVSSSAAARSLSPLPITCFVCNFRGEECLKHQVSFQLLRSRRCFGAASQSSGLRGSATNPARAGPQSAEGKSF